MIEIVRVFKLIMPDQSNKPKSKLSVAHSGVYVASILLVLGFSWASGMHFIAAYLTLGLAAYFVFLIWKEQDNLRSLSWMPVAVAVILFLDFFVFNLSTKLNVLDRILSFAFPILPVASVFMYPPDSSIGKGSIGSLKFLAGKIFILILYMPVGAGFYMFGFSEKIPKEVFKRKNYDLVLYEERWLGNSLALYKEEFVLPGIVKRTNLNSVGNSGGAPTYKVVDENTLLVESEELGQLNWKLP